MIPEEEGDDRMFCKVGSDFTVKFLITDDVGGKIADASPVCKVVKDADMTYWNGSAWASVVSELQMENEGGCVYTYTVRLPEAGNYTINCDDNINRVHDMIALQAYEGSDRAIYAAAEHPYAVKFLVIDSLGERKSDASPVVTILRDSDNLHWDGTAWAESSAELSMMLFEDGVYVYSFFPDQVGEYTITCTDSLYGASDGFSLNVMSLSSVGDPRTLAIANWQTIKAPDGTDSMLKDSSGNTLGDVDVTAYDASGRPVTQCISTYDGKWQLFVEPGTYRFEFKKDRYVTRVLERTVG